jgi:restriction endonuclease S subunit
MKKQLQSKNISISKIPPPLEINLPKPRNWKSFRLHPKYSNDFIKKITSGTTPKTDNDDYWNGDILWLTPKDLTRNKNLLINGTQRQITNKAVKDTSLSLFDSNTIFLSKRAPVGKVGLSSMKMTCNQGIFAIECSKKINPFFLCHWFKANKKYLNQLANGTTFQELYLDDLAEIEIFIPDLVEQNKICKFLNRLEFLYDTSISINSDKILNNGFQKSNDDLNEMINQLRNKLIFAVIGIDEVIKKIR